MEPHRLVTTQRIRQPLDRVFSFFAEPANLERITPAYLRFKVLTPPPIDVRLGTLIDYQLTWRVVPMRWQSRIAQWDPPRRFVDVQVRGPYRLWEHTHTFEPDGDGVLITDDVRYLLPLGPIGRVAHRLGVRRDLERIFEYRRQVIRQLFDAP